MPNHVKNVWKIKNLKPADVPYILNKFAVQYDRPGIGKEYIMDFDLIIPEPRFIKDCPKECIVNKDSHVTEDKDRPWFNWYEWHVKYWGTKWGAYDGYTKVGATQITFIFETAWSFAEPVARKLASMNYDLDIKYADEDWGSNCGKITYNAETGEWSEENEHTISNPDRFARDLWNRY